MTQLSNNNKVVGLKQSKRVLEGELVQKAYIAKDIDEKMLQTLHSLCQSKGVEVVWVDSMSQLGHACGIQVGAAIAVLLK